MKFLKHLKTVIIHRHKVMIHCFKCGLFWQGLVHDLSKFSRVEFFEGVKYYTGTYSPITACRNDKGYSRAWINHINKNKHHTEYWFDAQNKEQMNMPVKYAMENICDRIAASKVYNGNNYKPDMVLDYWLTKREIEPTNERMKKYFDKVYSDLKNFGEDFVLKKKYLIKTYNEIVIEKQGSK